MNSYEKRLVERYGALSSDIESLQARAAAEERDMTVDELRAAQGMADEAKTIYPQVTVLREMAKATADVLGVRAAVNQATGVTYGAGQRMYEGPRSLSNAQVERAVQSLRSGLQWSANHEDSQLRAAITLSETGGAVLGGFPEVQVPRTIANVAAIAWVQSDYRGVSGPQYPALANHAGIAESGSKPEAAQPTALTIVPQVFARYNTATLQALLSGATGYGLGDVSSLSQYHARLIARDEDLAFITAVESGATAITVANFAALPGGIRAALAQTTSDTALTADLVIVNPGDYNAAAVFAPTSGLDVGTFVDRIGTAKVYVSDDVAAGTVLVGASQGVVGVQAMAFNTRVCDIAPLTNTFTVLSEEVRGFGVQVLGSWAAITITSRT